MKSDITLSIIIVNYNSKSVLTDCLASLFGSEQTFEYEVFVIDNASSENLQELEEKYPEVIFIYNKANVGFAAANNIGIEKSSGKYLLLLNPDTIVNSNSFLPMIEYLNENNEVGIVGCKIFNEDGEIEHSTHSFPSLLKEFFHANEYLKPFFGYDSILGKTTSKIFKTKSLKSYWAHDSIKEVDHVTGACMMIKREAVEKVGLLDEAFFIYTEEVEWSYRMKQAGYKSVFNPDSNIIHLFGYSTNQKVQRQQVNHLLLERYRGMLYFFQKHYKKYQLLILRLIILQGFSFRLLANFIKWIFNFKNRTTTGKEINYIIKIMALSFKSNFDWRQ